MNNLANVNFKFEVFVSIMEQLQAACSPTCVLKQNVGMGDIFLYINSKETDGLNLNG